MPIFPLACPKSKFSPVYVNDLADIIFKSIKTDDYDNKICDVTGPKNYTFFELIQLVLNTSKMWRLVIPLNSFLSKFQALVFTYLPGKLFTLDNYKSLQVDNISEDGIKCTTSVEDILESYLTVKKSNLDKIRENSGR